MIDFERRIPRGERRDRVHLAADRLISRAQAEKWTLGQAPGFWTRDLSVAWQSTSDRSRPFVFAIVGDSAASAGAPRALWMGAGTGQGRPMLLRAHPLLDSDVVNGPMFGRRITFGNAESQHPLRQTVTGSIAVAVFVDAARAWDGLGGLDASPFQVEPARVSFPASAGCGRHSSRRRSRPS